MPTDSPHETRPNAAAFSPQADDVFARIAGRYDLLCDVFSLCAHRLWKARMAARMAAIPAAAIPAATILDVASGTGDIPARLIDRLPAGASPRILVTDLCPQMLALARKKLAGRDALVRYAIVDVHELADIPSATVDVYSMAFAMKICDRHRALAEAYRVLKPGGTVLSLEAARIPVEWLHQAYLGYMRWCLPTIAGLLTRDRSSHDYLLKGIHDFPGPEAFAREIEAHGFREARFERLTFGIVALHWAVKPAS